MAFPDQPFSLNLTEPCFAPPITLCIHKNADRSAVARCDCCMRLALAIAVTVNDVRNVKKAAPHGSHAESVPSSGPLPRTTDHLLLCLRLKRPFRLPLS